MIKSILAKLLMKYGSKLIYELVKMILGKVKDHTKTEFDNNMYDTFVQDEDKIKSIIDENSKEIKQTIKKFKK